MGWHPRRLDREPRARMHFLAPEAFYFLAALPVVILFYLLKRRRVVKLVSSTLLWQKFLAETQASAPFQRLRYNWLLGLQLLLLLLIIFALARPFFAAPTVQGKLLVALLDASASMQSTDESPNRFEKARTEILQLIDALHDNDRMVVLVSAANTEVKQSPTSNKAALRRAVQSCAVTDGPTRLTEGLKLAETLTRDSAAAEIHLFSDGIAPNLHEFENKGLRLVYHCLGRRGRNAGIVSLDVRANPEDPAQRAVFASVMNCSTNRLEGELELRFDDQVLGAKPITLKPRETLPQVFVAPQSRDGIFKLRLIVDDDLSADNQAAVVSLLPQAVKVLLVTRGNQFLEKALRASANLQLSTARELTDAAAGFDVVVLDNVTPVVWPAGSVLAIHTANTNWFDSWAPTETPPIVDWKNTHPLLRFVGFDNVQIAESLAVTTPPWAVALVESPRTPLILAGEWKRQRIVWIGFDILNSTWPLRFSFPIFIVNAVEWLNPAAEHASQLLVRAGDPFRFTLAQSLTNSPVKVILPDGASQNATLDSTGREIIFGDTARQGVYRVEAGTNSIVFCVDLLDAAESDTTPHTELQFGKYATVTATTLRRANLEQWRWIALAGFLVLLFEWWFYHRRTA